MKKREAGGLQIKSILKLGLETGDGSSGVRPQMGSESGFQELVLTEPPDGRFESEFGKDVQGLNISYFLFRGRDVGQAGVTRQLQREDYYRSHQGIYTSRGSCGR